MHYGFIEGKMKVISYMSLVLACQSCFGMQFAGGGLQQTALAMPQATPCVTVEYPLSMQVFEDAFSEKSYRLAIPFAQVNGQSQVVFDCSQFVLNYKIESDGSVTYNISVPDGYAAKCFMCWQLSMQVSEDAFSAKSYSLAIPIAQVGDQDQVVFDRGQFVLNYKVESNGLVTYGVSIPDVNVAEGFMGRQSDRSHQVVDQADNGTNSNVLNAATGDAVMRDTINQGNGNTSGMAIEGDVQELSPDDSSLDVEAYEISQEEGEHPRRAKRRAKMEIAEDEHELSSDDSSLDVGDYEISQEEGENPERAKRRAKIAYLRKGGELKAVADDIIKEVSKMTRPSLSQLSAEKQEILAAYIANGGVNAKQVAKIMKIHLRNVHDLVKRYRIKYALKRKIRRKTEWGKLCEDVERLYKRGARTISYILFKLAKPDYNYNARRAICKHLKELRLGDKSLNEMLCPRHGGDYRTVKWSSCWRKNEHCIMSKGSIPSKEKSPYRKYR